MPSLSLFQTFEVVARRSSFTLAADEMCLTQSAVSRQIRALEDQLGLRLFRRLLRSHNQYLDYTELLEQVWEGIRSPSTIRSAVKILRRQLNQAGMSEVAQAIVGSVPGHYCLKADQLQ